MLVAVPYFNVDRMLQLRPSILLVAALFGAVSASIGPKAHLLIRNKVLAPDGFSRV